jgi:hypothetical protein
VIKKNGIKSLSQLEKNVDEVFLGSNSQHGSPWAHPLGNKNIYNIFDP